MAATRAASRTTVTSPWTDLMVPSRWSSGLMAAGAGSAACAIAAVAPSCAMHSSAIAARERKVFILGLRGCHRWPGEGQHNIVHQRLMHSLR